MRKRNANEKTVEKRADDRKSCFRVKKAAALMLCALVSVVYYAGCGASGNEAADNYAVQSMAGSTYTNTSEYGAGGGLYAMDAGAVVEMEEEKTAEEATEDTGTVGEAAFDERKLIKTVDMEMETREFDRMMSTLEKQVQDMGGYIESMDTYNGSSYSDYRSSRYAYLTIRIPKARLDEFLETVSDIGNVVRRSDNVEDVTLSYVDMESRRDTLRTEQERLLELLERAETTQDIIAIEERLSNVRYHLESMESQLRTIDNQVDYSTVNLDISEVRELTPVAEQTVPERIAQGFVDSLRDIGDGAVEFVIWFIVNIPYLIIWAAVITAVILLIRKQRRKRKQRKEAELAKTREGLSETKTEENN